MSSWVQICFHVIKLLNLNQKKVLREIYLFSETRKYSVKTDTIYLLVDWTIQFRKEEQFLD